MTGASPAWDESLPGLRSRLVRRARSLGVDAETAEDLAQEALAEGWRLRDRLYDPAGIDLVDPHLVLFRSQVKDGTFDHLLLQPAPAIFLASLGASAPLALAQVVLGAGVVAYGVHLAEYTFTVPSVIAWLVLLITATAIMWSTRVLISAVAFWAVGFGLDMLYDALWQFARYPTHLYPRVLQIMITYVFPITFIATVPVDVLIRGGRLAQIPAALAAAITTCALAALVWRRGLRRYTSATS